MKDNNKHRNPHKLNHPRQHTSNLKSNSKSNDKFKQRSDTKLLSKPKTKDNHQSTDHQSASLNAHLNHTQQTNHPKTITSKKTNSMNQYYNQIQGKSKSKRKLATNQQTISRTKFVNNIYMHKEEKDNLTVILGQNDLTIGGHERPREPEIRGYAINTNLLNKIKSIEKAGGFDFNGKYISKDSAKHTDTAKNTDSQHQTISLYEQDKRKDGLRKKDKTRKEQIKNRLRKQQKTAYGNSKLAIVKSADKMYKKKDIKQVNSPNILTKHERSNASQFTILHENQQKIKSKDNGRLQMALIGNRTNKNILSEQTLANTPQVVNLHEPSILVNDFIKQLRDDNKDRLNHSKLKVIFANLQVQRVKCIELMSRISASMNIRRESHSLAIYYIDKYMLCLQKEVTPKQLKLIALTAILLSTKIDDGIMARKLCHQYINHMSSILNTNKTPTKNKSLQKNKQMGALSSKDTSSSNLRSVGLLGLPIASQLATIKQEGKISQRQQSSNTKELAIIHSLELDMLVKFSFKLVKKSTTYWIDILSVLWDKYIFQEQLSGQEYLSFRSMKNKKNISHCYQILELLSLSIDCYRYSSSCLVLSAMYLIIRMRLQEHKQGTSDVQIYSKYINDLSKSTNLIFYDKVGINELFGDFLVQFEMNLSDIIECIQFIGRNLIPSFKTFTFQSKCRVHSTRYEYQLSIYEENGEIFKAKGIQS